jgi:hypothetical protein
MAVSAMVSRSAWADLLVCLGGIRKQKGANNSGKKGAALLAFQHDPNAGQEGECPSSGRSRGGSGKGDLCEATPGTELVFMPAEST